jgi:dihydroorotate dehydrogenase (NAD+) catalytic subunit
VVALAAAARDAGADAICLTGRHLGFLPDPETRRPVLGTFGAIGGGWALPLALRWVAKTRRALGPDVPLIATGGIRTGLDVARALLAGASAVQVATVPFTEGPAGITRLRDELAAYLERTDVGASAIVGEAADGALTYEQAAAAAADARSRT